MEKTLEELQALDYPSKPRKRKRKQITKYHPQKALEIITRVSEGETLRSICKPEKGMPSMNTFLRWVSEYPDLRNAFEAAKTLSAYVMEEEAIDMARGATQQALSQNALRALTLAIDQLRWSATRRDPKNYSDKGNQAIVVPIHINTSLDMGEEGNAGHGTKEFPDIYALTAKIEEKKDVVDGEFSEVPASADAGTGVAVPNTVNPFSNLGNGSGVLDRAAIFDPQVQRNEARKEVIERFERRKERHRAYAAAKKSGERE